MATEVEHLEGASVWDEEVYETFREHVEEENRILDLYRKVAGTTGSPDVEYLVKMIMEDEKRHHKVFEQLAETVRDVVALEPATTGVPDIPLRRDGAAALRRTTAELLRFEREDAKKLRQLKRSLRPVGETTLWPLLIETMQLDTKKHILILEHIERIAGGLFGD